MEALQKYIPLLEKEISAAIPALEPVESSEPLQYFLKLGGKRIRPALVLFGYELFSNDFEKAVPQALAIELFHNFTLIHDDIMDRAPLRRGKETVHIKWGENTAILSGDLLMIYAYEFLLKGSPANSDAIYTLFNCTAREVCLGQQMDLNFETRDDVSLEAYIRMIELKTSVLLGAALQIGALAANASDQDAESLYEFGRNIGIAFQINDDRIDLFSPSEKTGKQAGGDIIANKKTFLSLKALEIADNKSEATQILFGQHTDHQQKVSAAKDLLVRLDIENLARKEAQKYFELGKNALEKVNANPKIKAQLLTLANELMVREH